MSDSRTKDDFPIIDGLETKELWDELYKLIDKCYTHNDEDGSRIVWLREEVDTYFYWMKEIDDYNK